MEYKKGKKAIEDSLEQIAAHISFSPLTPLVPIIQKKPFSL